MERWTGGGQFSHCFWTFTSLTGLPHLMTCSRGLHTPERSTDTGIGKIYVFVFCFYLRVWGTVWATCESHNNRWLRSPNFSWEVHAGRFCWAVANKNAMTPKLLIDRNDLGSAHIYPLMVICSLITSAVLFYQPASKLGSLVWPVLPNAIRAS